MLKIPRSLASVIIGLLVLSQIAFAFYAERYTKASYQGQLFTTIGIRYDGTDLHKLNEGAHYFGQTLIGWTKFPRFQEQLIEFAALPHDVTLRSHMQERQNIIFQISSKNEITGTMVDKMREFIDEKLKAYNKIANVTISLANIDSQITKSQRNYFSGAAIFALLTLIAAGGIGLLMRTDLNKKITQ